MSTQVPARAQRIYAVWSKLDDAPLNEVEFLAAILRALKRGPGAEADVSAMKFLLTSSGAVTVGSDEFGATTYRRSASFPEHPRNDIGSAAYDQQNRELAQEQEAQHDRDAEAAFKGSPQARQRAELLALIDARIDERILELRRLAASAETAQARSLRRQQVGEGLRAATTQNGDAA
jgi:hypothetical protein